MIGASRTDHVVCCWLLSGSGQIEAKDGWLARGSLIRMVNEEDVLHVFGGAYGNINVLI